MAKKKTKTGPKPETERRRHKRSKPNKIALSIGGKQYPTRNLSIGGSLISDYEGPLSAGSMFTLTGIGPEGGEMTSVEVSTRVNRAEGSQLALTFLELDTPAYEILQAVMAEKIEGLEMTVKSDPVSEQD